MKDKKSVGLIIMWIYLICLSVACLRVFAVSNEAYSYVLSSSMMTEKSVMEDVINYSQSDQEWVASAPKKVFFHHFGKILKINSKRIKDLTPLFVYGEILLILLTMFYFLSGLYLFWRSKKYKIFFYSGMLSLGIGFVVFWFFNNTLILSIQEMDLETHHFMKMLEPTMTLLEPMNMMPVAQKAYFVHIALSFVFFVAIPMFVLSRKSLKEQLR